MDIATLRSKEKNSTFTEYFPCNQFIFLICCFSLSTVAPFFADQSLISFETWDSLSLSLLLSLSLRINLTRGILTQSICFAAKTVEDKNVVGQQHGQLRYSSLSGPICFRLIFRGKNSGLAFFLLSLFLSFSLSFSLILSFSLSLFLSLSCVRFYSYSLSEPLSISYRRIFCFDLSKTRQQLPGNVSTLTDIRRLKRQWIFPDWGERQTLFLGSHSSGPHARTKTFFPQWSRPICIFPKIKGLTSRQEFSPKSCMKSWVFGRREV